MSQLLGDIKGLWTNERVRYTLMAGLAAFVVYEISREPGTQVYNQYVRLADAFLHGRVDIAVPDPWLELSFFQGRAYSHQGVLPGILLMPFVAIFGSDINLKHFAAFLGAGIGMAAWSLATRIGLRGWDRVLAWCFPILGTTIWFEAKAGSTWGVAALSSVLFLFLALNEYFGPRRFWLVGLLVGIAALARPPAGLALLAFVLAAWLARSDAARWRRMWRLPRPWVLLALGVAGPLAIYVGYNLLRFGTITDLSQHLHYVQDGFRTQRPPGQFSLAHAPFNLYSWFLMSPDFQANFPYIKLTILGTGLPLTSPAFLSGFGAKRERWLWLAAGLVIIPATLHYANGFTQFGMRYLLDTIPFLSAAVFIAMRDSTAPGFRVLLAWSIAFNAYGVAYTTVFGLQ